MQIKVKLLIRETNVEILFHGSLVVAAGVHHPLARRRKFAFAELMNEPWALQSPDNSYFGAQVAEVFRISGHPFPTLTVATTSFHLRGELLATGRFLTVVSSFSLKLPRKHSSLMALLVGMTFPPDHIAIITVKGRSLSPLAQLFCERVRALTKPLA